VPKKQVLRRSSRATIAALALAAAGLGACGGGNAGSGEGPEAVVARYYASKDDPAALCATLSRSFAAVYGGRERCERVVVPSTNPQQHIDVRSVEREGDRATVVFHIEGGGTGEATVVREQGAWRLDHLTQSHQDEAEREREERERDEAAPSERDAEPAPGESEAER
jgi:hypothetical protein